MSFSFRNLFSPDDSELDGSEGSGGSAFAPSFGSDSQARGNPAPREPMGHCGQSFMVSELLPLIPTAIVASSGIPMEKEILVPVPVDGSLDVKLSTLYQLCPELFAAEITPLNDSVLTLPPRVGASIAATAEGVMSAFWSPVTPSVSSVASSSAASTPIGNPFYADADPGRKSLEPVKTNVPDTGTATSGLDTPATNSAPNPFGGIPHPPSGENQTDPVSGLFGFGLPGNSDAESEPKPGYDPFEGGTGFSTLFSKQAEQDAVISHPANPFADPAIGPAPEGVWGAMFRREVKEEPPTVIPDFDSIGNLLGQTKKSFEAQAIVTPPTAKCSSSGGDTVGFSTGLGGFATKVEPLWDAKEVPINATRPDSPGSVDPNPTPATKTIPPEPTMTSVHSIFEAPQPNAPSPSLASVEAVFAAAAAPLEVVSGMPVDLPEPVASVVSETPTVPVPISIPTSSQGDDDELRDLEMRAIFSTSERFNLSNVARKVISLPGINSCSLSTPVKIVHASRSDETRLGNEAREMIATLRSLAKLTGLPEARTFTLQTDRGIVSLFLDGDCCVSVNQDSAAFHPGVREKLTLIARSIGKLRE